MEIQTWTVRVTVQSDQKTTAYAQFSS